MARRSAQGRCDLQPSWRPRVRERLHRPGVTRAHRRRNLRDGEVPLSLLPDSPSPHGWDAGVLFEETQRTLLCSDLFHQNGDVEPLSSADVVGRSRQAMKEYQAGILAEYVPYTPHTAQNLKKLAELNPKTLAIMHGSSFTGDCARALDDLNVMLREVFGTQD